MAKFVLVYLGGGPPTNPEDGKKVMDAWMAWFGRVGSDVVDAGAPIGPRQMVGAKAAGTGAAGYSIITADNLAAAVKLTDGHPHLMSGGSIEVCETVPIPM